ncbi:hypothetical protein [Williamsia sp. CHRR-6]|uniref:hypothetical protein n=1 Tax=Williamsia sp. CHRR-6 TaxID=2835871 RepID=UPI001BDB333A|nr:hypothetical protein [Williamsia sp. CHRR-6]MBT0567264.1 hypothetical protein [Williamsia sp. CHRR-6]
MTDKPKKPLLVDVAELRLAAHQVAIKATMAAGAAEKGFNAIESHEAGWIGDSKKALVTAVKELRSHSGKLTGELTKDSHLMVAAANKYSGTEASNSAHNRSAASGLNLEH